MSVLKNDKINYQENLNFNISSDNKLESISSQLQNEFV